MIQNMMPYLGLLFLFYILVYITFNMLGSLFSLWELHHQRKSAELHNELDDSITAPISILVPAYNESETILSTIKNLLLANYENFEIIVIDDGSTDDTASLVIDYYSLTRNTSVFQQPLESAPLREVYTGTIGNHLITLIRKDNGKSKADAMNAGINVARYPYFVAMDGDEILQADALKNAARYILEDHTIIAVGGMIGVANDIIFKEGYPIKTPISKNLIVNSQRLEYNRSFMSFRVFSDVFNGNLNSSGGFGLFNKEAVVQIGGYDKNSVGEDMDLVLRLHKAYLSTNRPYTMRYAPSAVCWTQVPMTLKDLGKQRARWHRGLIQAMWAHRELFLNFKYGAVSLVSFTYYFLYEFMSPMMELLGFITIILALITQSLNIPFAILLTVTYAIFNMVHTFIFYIGNFFIGDLNPHLGNNFVIFGVSLLDILFIRPYLFFVRIYAILTYRSKLHNWSKLKREKFQESSEES